MTAWNNMTLWERMVREHEDMKKAHTAQYEAELDDVAKYTRPDLPFEADDEGGFYGSDLYEGTSAFSPRQCAAGIAGWLFGPKMPWIRYGYSDRRFKGVDEINAWLQARREEREATYRRSDFYSVGPRYVLDGITIGSPIMIPEEDAGTGKIHCNLPHYSTCFFTRDRFGNIDRLHIEDKWAAKDAFAEWGRDSLSQTLQRSMDIGQPNTKYTFIQAIYRKYDQIFDGLKDAPIFEPDWEYVCIYIELATDHDKRKPLSVDGYKSKPHCVWDWERNSHEIRARTPAWHAIYDIKGSQVAWKTHWQRAEYEGNPAAISLDSMRGRLSFLPGARNFASPTEMETPPNFIERGGNLRYETECVERITRNIDRWFLADLFTMIRQYSKEHGQPPTAYQISQMVGENMVLLGTQIASAEGMLADIDARFDDIENRAGRLPMPWHFGLDIDDLAEPEFIGLLAQSQTIHMELQRIQGALAGFVPLLEIHPPLVHKVRWGKMAERVLEASNLDQDLIVPEDEYNEVVAQLQQQEQAERDIASAREVAGAVADLGKPTDPSSPLKLITGAA